MTSGVLKVRRPRLVTPMSTSTRTSRPPRPPGPLRILLVEDDTLVGLGHKAQLEKLGHTVLAQASRPDEARSLYAAQKPDLVLMDIRLDGDGGAAGEGSAASRDGLDLAAELLKERRCPMVVVTAYGDKTLIDRAVAAGVYGYLIKPVADAALEAQIEVALRRFEEAEQLRAEKEKLASDLETRRLMDRAKAILIKRAGLSEDDAHRRLQQESQKKRIGMAELCRKIIDAEELMGG